METRGQQKGEFIAAKSFWRANKMEDVIKMTSKQLDKAIEEFFEVYQARQIKANHLWWYPEDPITVQQNKARKLRKAKSKKYLPNETWNATIK